MATVIPIGEPVNEAERQAIAHLRDHLPASYLVLHNFEILRDGETFEVDVAVIAPHAVFLVDVKGTRGLIDVYGPKWYPEGRQPFSSPLAKLRGHAKAIKGVITSSQPGRRDLEDIYVDAAVVLTSPDATLVDQGGRDSPNVTTLKKAAAFFQNSTRIPAGKSKNIGAHHNIIMKALQGVAKPRSGPLRFGNWQVLEKLGGTDSYVEYRAFNAIVGPEDDRAHPRVPGRPVQAAGGAREAEAPHLDRVPRAQLDAGPPRHRRRARVLRRARARTSTSSSPRTCLGQALRVHIEKPALALTLDQKITHRS
jgi:hypothetical protein